MNPAGLVMRPVCLHHSKTLAGVIVPRYKQRALGVTLFKRGQAALELGRLVWQLAGFAGAHRKRHAVRLHAHAARFIDSSSTTIKLPGHPQGGGGGNEHQQ